MSAAPAPHGRPGSRDRRDSNDSSVSRASNDPHDPHAVPEWDWSPLWPHWDRRAARVAGAAAPPLPPQRAFALIARAAEPFRAGTRFMALPDVRFYRDGAQQRAPGDLLPGAEDRGDPLRYLQRVRERLGGARFQLRVAHPLFLDYALWARTRALLAPLFARLGTPALPVEASLWIGDADAATLGLRLAPRHALIHVPLLGACALRAWPARPAPGRAPAQALRAQPGQALCWPGRHWHEESDEGGCLGLALRVPLRGGEAMIAAKDALADCIDAELGADERVAMLAFPPPRAQRGATALAPLARVAAAMRGAVRAGELEQALRAGWAERVSADALEPVPAPRRAPRLRAGDEVECDPRNRLLRLREGEGWRWAVAGHSFAMPEHPRLDRLLAHLREGRARVSALCARETGRGADPDLVAVLQRLYELRALRRCGEAELEDA